MSRTAYPPLFLPIEDGFAPAPTPSSPALVFGAEAGFRSPAGVDRAAWVCVQPFRPDYLALKAAGFEVGPTAPAALYASAYVVASRYRARTEAFVETALTRLLPGGILVVAGGLMDGGDAAAKRLKARFPGGERRSKRHGVVFFAQVASPMAQPAPGLTTIEEGWLTAPGSFSADAIDPASCLLLDSLPGDLTGRVADFGAGWGYLAGSLGARSPGVCHIDLYEADYLALQAAKANLAARLTTVEAGFFWQDVVAEPVTRRYDAIVMNPPFHVSRAADPQLGKAFIAAAAAALKPGGRLFLVANRNLPYERTLADMFASSGELRVADGFKVLFAIR